MRILAIDHGTVRMGLALSDELKMLAHPLDAFPAEPLGEFLAALQKLVPEKQIELVLVGMPRNMDGSFGPAAQKVKEFVEMLRQSLTVPIKTLDERLSSVQAHKLLAAGGTRSKQRKDRVDGSAAAILLQSYLDTLS